MKIKNTLKNLIISLDKPSHIWKQIDQSCKIQYFWLGKQPYLPIWELQKELHARRVSGDICDTVLFLEHDHVYTLGKNAETDFILQSKLDSSAIVQIDRGGQVTYHGPGQLVCYPIIDLHNYKMSVSWYMRSLESIIINYLKEFDINADRKEDFPGVWIGDEKICAMGVRLSKWVTMHGFALNIKPEMQYYDNIIPCGIFEYGVTSLQELGVSMTVEKCVNKLLHFFQSHFLENKIEV